MALDEKGITLEEVTSRYPRKFQTLGYDVLMDVDSYNKPKVISTFEMCINTIITLLKMKPGQYPSIPDLGIDIEQYLHEYADDMTIPEKIKSQLNDQCNRLQMTGIQINCFIDKMSDGTNALVVQVDGTDRLAYGHKGPRVLIGISFDKLNRLYTRRVYL